MTPDQDYCVATLAEWAGGEHHLPTVKEFGAGVCINWSGGDLSTFDFNGLTRLVILAHRDAVRIEIASSGPRLTKIIAHKRQHGDRKELGFLRYHPGLKELAQIVRDAEPKQEQGAV